MLYNAHVNVVHKNHKQSNHFVEVEAVSGDEAGIQAIEKFKLSDEHAAFSGSIGGIRVLKLSPVLTSEVFDPTEKVAKKR